MGRSCARLALVLLALHAWLADGLYFYVTEGQNRCFLQEVPQDTLVVIVYENPDLIPPSGPNQPAQVSPRLRPKRRRPLPTHAPARASQSVRLVVTGTDSQELVKANLEKKVSTRTHR